MSSPVVDFGKNFLNLKYQVGYRCFSFENKAAKKSFIEFMNKTVFKNPLLKVNCSDKTFSSIDGASKKFIESDFYMNMLDSLGYSKNEDIIKNMKGFKKMDINFDLFCGRDKTIIKQMEEAPWEYINSKTPVCYIFTPSLKDERYEYNLYVKFFIRGNEVNVMSLHWDDYYHKDMPERVFNYQTLEYDNIEKVNEFLEEKLNYYERER